jgi:hypothetical protein
MVRSVLGSDGVGRRACWRWDVLLWFNDMRRRGCGPRAERGMMVSNERYAPEAHAMFLSRACKDNPACVVMDNESSFVEHDGAIVVTQLAQTNKIVGKAVNDVTRARGTGESRWERKESTSSGELGLAHGRVDYGARDSGAGGNRGARCEVVVTGPSVSNSGSGGVWIERGWATGDSCCG